MKRVGLSRIIPIILIVIVIIIAIAAIVGLGRAIFSGGSAAPNVTDTSEQALLSTDPTSGVKMEVRGPIVASENFHSYDIDVTPNARDLTTYQGYDKSIVATVSLANSTKSYEQFVYALDKANLAKGTAFTGDKDDTRGVCATGLVYEFTIYQGSSTIKHLWTSTCNGSRGSLDASITQLKNLFTEQIPNANQLTSKVDL